MKSKLWQKHWTLNGFVETFETKDDLLLDQKLLKFDVYGSITHAKMLTKIGILNSAELKTLQKGLLEILSLAEKGKFVLQKGDEDIHTKIEQYLTQKYGDVGKKIHTGRSRNDQVLVDMRLFTKEKLFCIWKALLTLSQDFNTFAKQYEFIPMPGYTHMQKAMPSSVGMWAGAFAEAFLDDLSLLKAAFSLNDQCPLGSAAGYGVPLPLDRKYSASLLGFSSVQINSLYSQNSRGKIESASVAAINTILLDISRFASDVMLFTTSEFNFFKVADELCSGSSIMPQKRNVDVAELLRSKANVGVGCYVQIMGVASSLISGYNRDLQDTKKPFIECLELALDCIQVASILITNLTLQEEKLKKSLTPEIFATHDALKFVGNGVPFRSAYKMAGVKNNGYKKNIVSILKSSTHIGGTGNLCLKTYSQKIQKEAKIFTKEQRKFVKALKNLEKLTLDNY